MAKTVKKYLIIRASGDTRIVTRNPSWTLRNDEIAYQVNIKIPDAWGRMVSTSIDITLPDPVITVDADLL